MARNESLFRRYRQRGDVRALGKLFDRTADETLRVAMYFARDPAQAEEWLQETYLIAIEQAEGWDETRRFTPWLLGILRNVVRRSHAARGHVSLPDRPLPATPLSDAVDELEWTAAVSEAVQRLRDPYRAVLILRLQHGLEPAEIAQLQRVPAATIRSQIHRGLMKLRLLLPRDRCSVALAALPLPVGLMTVRSKVLAAAEAGAPAVTAAGALAGFSLLGGLVVHKVVWMVLTAAALVLTALDPLGFWSGDADVEDPSGPRRVGALPGEGGSVAQGADAPVLRGRGTAMGEQERRTTATAGPDVDLDTVDRDRDLHGIVVFRDGRPVIGARVRVESAPWQSLMTNDGWDGEWIELAATTTGRRGTFALRLAAGARGRLHVVAPGYAARRLLSASAGERVRIVMDRSVSLIVRVRAPDGSPAAEVPIRAWGAGALDQARTDAEGSVRLDGLDPQGSITLWPMPQTEGWGIPMMTKVTLPAEGTHEELIELPAGRTIRGIVTDAGTGEPIANAVVGMLWLMDPRVRTDEKGLYVLHGWTGLSVDEITARHAGYDRKTRRVEGDTEVVDFSLRAGAQLRGRVVNEAGLPVRAALVAIIGSTRENGAQRLSLANGRTDAEGRFVLGGLATDLPHSINVRAVGYGRRMVDIDAVEGAERDVGDIVLAAPVQLIGRVLGRDGKPGARLAITIKGVNADRAKRRASQKPAHDDHYGTYEKVTTDDLGRFRVADLCPATYTITCQPPNGPPVKTVVVLSQGKPHRPVTLRLSGTRRLRIRVFDPDGGPVTGAEIVAVHERKPFRAVLDTQGQALLEIPDTVKTVRLQIHGKNDLVDLGPIRVPLDSDELVVHQRRAAWIRGSVLKPDGTPLARAMVMGQIEGVMKRHAVTDKAGTFDMKCAPGEVLDVVVQGQVLSEDGTQALRPLFGEKKNVRCGASGVRIQTVSLAGSKTLRILVVGPDGAPLEGLPVLLLPTQSGMYDKTNAEGRAVFEGLSSAGRIVRIIGGAKGEVPWSTARIPVTPGGALVTVQMTRAVRVSGRVLMADGSPAAGVFVHALSGQDPPMELGLGFSTKKGGFLLDVPASTTRMRLRATKAIGGVAFEAEVVLDAIPMQPVELRLAPR